MSKKIPQRNSSSGWLVMAVKIGLYACLFMPLIIKSSFIFPYIFPKQAFFQLLVEVLMGLYLFLALRQPNYRPRSSWLFKALLAYFVIMILSSVFGVNIFHSFWSNYERMAGVVSLLHYLAFLFVAANVLKTREDWYRFFDFSIIASVLEAFYGLGQIAGISGFIHGGSGNRIDGTIGNPSFLAGYMLLNALFAFWLMLEKKNVGWRYFYGVTILLNIFVLYQTETRGAIIAFAAGLIVLSFSFIFGPKQALAQLPFKNSALIKKYAMGVIVIFALAAGLIWFGRDSEFVKSRPTLGRITHISLSDVTSQTRLMAWQMSLKGFAERPIFGWGMENYNVVFNKYYNPNLYPVENWFDRSHNAYLDVLVHTGIFGFLAYASVFALAFWYLWRNWRRDRINYQTFVIFSVILMVYGIQNFVLFDTQITLLMIFSILAFVVYLSFNKDSMSANGQPVKPNYFFSGAVILLVTFCAYFINVKPGLASKNGIEALLLFNQGVAVKNQNLIAQSVEKFRQTYAEGTYGMPEIATRAHDLAMQTLSNSDKISGEQAKDVVKVAIEGLSEALDKYEPRNARLMLMLANLYLSSANSIDPNYLQQADVIFQKILELTPTRQEVFFGLAQLRFFQRRNEEVLPYLKTAVELNDKASLPHWNYGVFAAALGQVELSDAEIKKAIERGHTYDAGDIQLLINAYSQTSNLIKLESLYLDWINFSPTNAEPYARLAAVYAQMGDKQKAKETALKSAEIDPVYQSQADEFIKGLGI